MYGLYTVSYACGSQYTQEEKRLQLYRALYDGDRGATIQAIRSRYMAESLRDESGLEESRRNFPVQNELRCIIDRRIDAMPATFTLECEDESLLERAEEWAAGKVTTRGLSLYGAVSQLTADQEVDGNAATVMTKEEGASPVLAVRDTVDLYADADALTSELREVRFEWEESIAGGRSPAKQYREVITAESHLIESPDIAGGRFEAGGRGFLPVVIIPREVIHGSPIGRSGVHELFEAYLHFLWSAYMLNVANKYEGFGVYCPDGRYDTGALLGDDSNSQPTAFRISPGCLYPIPITKVGGGINIESIATQLREARRTLYKIGRVRESSDQNADMRSGKALAIDTHELRDYVVRKVALLRVGLESIFDQWAWLEGIVPVGEKSGITVEFDSLDGQDQAENTRRAELWLKLLQAGKCDRETFLRQWQRFGMLDPEADIAALEEKLAEAEESSAVESMNRLRAAMIGVGPPNGRPVPPRPPGQPPELTEDPEEVNGDG